MRKVLLFFMAVFIFISCKKEKTELPKKEKQPKVVWQP